MPSLAPLFLIAVVLGGGLVLFVAGAVTAIGGFWLVQALRGWMLDTMRELMADAERTRAALPSLPDDTVEAIYMDFARVYTNMEEYRARLKHVMENKGNWNDTPAQRAMYVRKPKEKKH